jgi:hypothetical protein
MAGFASALRFPVLVALLIPPSVASGQGPVVELRLSTRGGADGDVIGLASGTAIQLLRSAGIEAVWRDCSASVCPEDASRHPVLVHLMPVAKKDKPTVSGEFLRDGRTRTPTVLVYVPRLVATTGEVRRLRESRTNPLLLTLQPSHLIGLTIAHEVGHSLGLGHTDLGVMAARPSVREIVELRNARLAFDGRESSRMRMALANEFALLAAARD